MVPPIGDNITVHVWLVVTRNWISQIREDCLMWYDRYAPGAGGSRLIRKVGMTMWCIIVNRMETRGSYDQSKWTGDRRVVDNGSFFRFFFFADWISVSRLLQIYGGFFCFFKRPTTLVVWRNNYRTSFIFKNHRINLHFLDNDVVMKDYLVTVIKQYKYLIKSL